MSRLSFRLIWGLPVLIFVVAGSLGGCREAMPTSTDDKDEMAPPSEIAATPKEALMGTWQTVVENRDDDGNVIGTTTFTLTFTKTRAILLHTERDNDGEIVEADWCQCESGTWEASDSTITKTRVPWLEDALNPFNGELGFWGSEKVSVARDYVLVDGAKDVLLVHSWAGHEPTTSFERYTRIDDPIAGGLVTGMWAGEIDWPRPAGEEQITRWTFTFGESFTEHAIEETVTGPGASPSVEDFLLVGSVIHDTEEYVFSVTVESHTRTLDGAPADTNVAPGQVLRYAYAPTGNPDEIAVSLWWAEQDYDPDSQAFVDRETSEDRPVFADGRYQLRLKPVSR